MQTLLQTNVELGLEEKSSMLVYDGLRSARAELNEHLVDMDEDQDYTIIKEGNKLTLERGDVTMTQEWFEGNVVKDFPDYEFLGSID